MDFNDNNINIVLHNLFNYKKQYNFDFLEKIVLNDESLSNVYQKFLLRYSLNYCFSKKIWGNLNIITPDDFNNIKNLNQDEINNLKNKINQIENNKEETDAKTIL